MAESTKRTGPASDGNEVVKATGKRQFTDAYRIRIVEEANRCTPYGP